MSAEDNKYDSLRKRLKGLPKIQTKSDFDGKLFARIREAEHNKNQEPYKFPVKKKSAFGWLEGLFRPAFIPAMGLTVVLLAAIIVYFGYFAKSKNSAGEQNTFTSAPYQKEGEFVIYVKKDKEYPKNEIASTETGENTGTTSSSETYRTQPEVHSDYMQQAPKTEAPGIRMDKVSEEQRKEMEKSVDRGVMKTEEKKSDDMKGFKNSKEAPSNYLRENKDENNGKDVDQQLDGTLENQTINPSVKATTEDSVSTGKLSAHKRIVSKRGGRDTLKAKSEPIDSSDDKETDKK